MAKDQASNDQPDEQVNDAPAENQQEQKGGDPNYTSEDALRDAGAASPAAEPQGEVATDESARAHVVGDDADREFDPVAHGQQTGLENHQAERAENS